VGTYIDTIEGLHRALEQVRARFQAALPDDVSDSDNDIALLFETVDLLGPALASDDRARAVTNVLTNAVRDALAYWVLVESGFATVAPVCLRRSLEFLLIAADTAHNDESMSRWLALGAPEIPPGMALVDFTAVRRDRRETYEYFGVKSVVRRVRRSSGKYPPEVVLLVTGNSDGTGTSILREWARLSDDCVHAHSPHQVAGGLDGKGRLELLGVPADAGYWDLRHSLRIYLTMATSLFWLIPACQRLASELSAKQDERLARFNKRLLRAQLNIRGPGSQRELADFMASARPGWPEPPPLADRLPNGMPVSRIDVDFLVEPPRVILRGFTAPPDAS